VSETPSAPGAFGSSAEVPGALSPFSTMFGQLPDMQLNLDWVRFHALTHWTSLTLENRSLGTLIFRVRILTYRPNGGQRLMDSSNHRYKVKGPCHPHNYLPCSKATPQIICGLCLAFPMSSRRTQ
jgi:hypothetical protein